MTKRITGGLYNLHKLAYIMEVAHGCNKTFRDRQVPNSTRTISHITRHTELSEVSIIHVHVNTKLSTTQCWVSALNQQTRTQLMWKILNHTN